MHRSPGNAKILRLPAVAQDDKPGVFPTNLQLSQKALRLPSGFEDDDLFILGTIQQLVIPGPVVFVEIPDPFDEFRVDPFGAALRHVGTMVTPVFEHTAQPVFDADEPGVIQIDDRIAGLQPQLHGAVEIAVQDPPGLFKLRFQPLVKFRLLDVLPVSRCPPDLIQVHHGQPRLLPQLPGQGGFSGSTAADDHDSFHHYLL